MTGWRTGGLSRRRLLGGAAAGAGTWVVAKPPRALARPLRAPGTSVATRRSKLDRSTRLVHADLHNHSHFSDGTGNPSRFYDSMRDAGLDVAALTDHAIAGDGPLGEFDPCRFFPQPADGEESGCSSIVGVTPAAWRETARLAGLADTPGEFTALRGFEWSHLLLGHVNVWFSREFTDTFGSSYMRAFYDWLKRAPDTGWGDGGSDGLFGFNHPGREIGRFESFLFDAALRERLVSLEMFNRDEDFLFKGASSWAPSPLVQCLEAGWRPGLLGVTDEHGADWGSPLGKGRGGLWVRELSRAGVREAMAARRFFATRERGLRVDARANGVRMGGDLVHRSGPVRFAVDVDRGSDWVGKPLHVQVLRPQLPYPRVAHVEEIMVPAATEPPVRFTVDLDIDDGRWVVLRIADPHMVNDTPGPVGHPANNRAVAYASPFYLVPGP